MNGVPVPVTAQLLFYPFWGSDKTFPHYAAPWARAMDTPFKRTKQVASHFGGTAQGMAMSWPGHIKDAGSIRRQFHHIIDIAPTILEAAGIAAPETLNGVWQRAMDGVSMVYSWDKANTNAGSRCPTPYFEMLGNRAIYHDGWVAATTPASLPWELSAATPPDVIAGYKWELYNVAEDPTEFNDLAARMPEKLKQMQDIFYAEAKKHDVLPLDNTTLARWNSPKPNLTGGRKVFTYKGALAGVPSSGAPNILNKSYTITTEVTIPKGGAEGMIVTEGGRLGGYALFLSKGIAGIRSGKPVSLYNLLGLERTVWAGPELGAGKHTIVFDYKPDGPSLGNGGTGILSVDGKEVDRNSMKNSTPITFPEDETFSIGQDTRTGVAMVEYRYDVPFRFTGTINRLTFNLGPDQVTAEERAKMQETVARAISCGVTRDRDGTFDPPVEPRHCHGNMEEEKTLTSSRRAIFQRPMRSTGDDQRLIARGCCRQSRATCRRRGMGAGRVFREFRAVGDKGTRSYASKPSVAARRSRVPWG